MKLSDIDLPSNKKFGLFFTAVFAIASLYFFITGGITASVILALLAIAFVVISLSKPDLLLPLNKLWMRFGLLLGMIVSPIVLGVIFFLIFTPVAFGMRLFRRDELRLRPMKAASYWKKREPSGPAADSFKNQF